MNFIKSIAAMPKRIYGFIKNYYTRQKHYFKDNKRNLASNNLAMLVFASAVCVAFMFLLVVLSYIFIDGWHITIYHVLLFITFVAFLVFSLWYKSAQKQPNKKIIDIACVLFYIAIILQLSAVSIFPYPDIDEALASLGFMAMPLVFTLPYNRTVLLTASCEAIYITLAVIFKSEISAQRDIFSTLAASLFSLALYFCLLHLRMQNYTDVVRFQRKSQTDQLTGILNKTAFQNSCERYLHTCSTHEMCALFVIDVDNFKAVNDTHGHQTGDAVLELVGEVMMNTFRSSDMLGRFGGDEFCVLMRRIGDATDAAQKAVQLQKVIRQQSYLLIGQKVTCSIGIAICDKTLCNSTTLFALADESLYTSKQRGKNCATVKNIN